MIGVLDEVAVKLVDCQESWVALKAGHTAREVSSVDVVTTTRGWMIVMMVVFFVMEVNAVEACCKDTASLDVQLVDVVSSLDW